MASPHFRWNEVKVHTAKCDSCNKHNDSTLYRCANCGRHVCTTCKEKGPFDDLHALPGLLARGNSYAPTAPSTAQIGIIVEDTSPKRESAKKSRQRRSSTTESALRTPRSSTRKRKAIVEEDADAQLPSSDTPEAFSSPLKRMKVDSTGTGVATKSRDPPMGTFRTGNALKSSPPVSKGNTAAPKTPKGKVAKTPLTPRSRRTAKSINATQTSSDIEDGDNEQEIPYPGITTRRRSPVKYPTPDTSISTLTSLTSSPSDDNNTQHPNRRSQNSTLSNSISDVSENEEGKASEESALQRKFREMEEYKSQLEQQQKLREERKSQWNQDKRGLELLCEAVEEVEGRAF